MSTALAVITTERVKIGTPLTAGQTGSVISSCGGESGKGNVDGSFPGPAA